MGKHLLGLVVISIIVIMGMPYAHHGLQLLLDAHNWFAKTLTQVFTGGEAGNLTRNLIALLVIPFLIGLIPAGIYWLATRRWFPYFMEMVWVTWLVQTAAMVVVFR